MKRAAETDVNETTALLSDSRAKHGYFPAQSGCGSNKVMTGGTSKHEQSNRAPVYEVVAGQPTWGRLYRLASETTAHLAVNTIVRAIKTEGRSTVKCETALAQLSIHLNKELPAAIVRDVLNVCLARDRFRCHHNPTDCLALELWRVFYNPKFTDVSVVHHEFAFNKTTNYPDIVQNLEQLFSLISHSLPNPPSWTSDCDGLMSSTGTARAKKNGSLNDGYYDLDPPDAINILKTGENVVYDSSGGIDAGHDNNKSIKSILPTTASYFLDEHAGEGEKSKKQQIRAKDAKQKKTHLATITSFKLELKHCEIGCFLQDRIVSLVAKLADGLRILEIPGLGSDELLHVIALYCTNLEVLNIQGSREQVTDGGFARYVESASPEAKSKLRQLDISRCLLSQQVLVVMQALTGLRDLCISTRVLDEISYACDGQSVVLTVNNGNLSSINPSGMAALAAPVTSNERGGTQYNFALDYHFY